MRGPYVSDDGDVWIVRGDVPWPRAQSEARAYLDEMGFEDRFEYVMKFAGIEPEVRVSDEHEYVHYDDAECADSQGVDEEDPAFVPCCRTVEAYHFEAISR